jgi:hypothetical protein
MGGEMKAARSLAALAVAAAMLGTPAAARAAGPPAEAEANAFARVVVDSAELHTGPGVSYRTIYLAHRGETFALDGRPSPGFWLRVVLPDGRVAYALGDEVQTFAVDPNAEGAPSRPGVFAPPPLRGSRGGFSMVGGMLSIPSAAGSVQRFGYVEARASLVLHETVSLEGFAGDGLTSDGAQILYGGGVSVYLAPRWVVCPFVGLFAGGLSVLPNADSFVLKREDLYLARAGGGLLFALRNRILVRVEVTDLSLFNAEKYKNAQTYAAGLGVYF